MKEIDFNNWKRKEHFEFFRRMDIPLYNVNLSVDITGVREFAKANKISFNNTLIYLTTGSLNKIENFRYRLRGETVIVHDKLNPSFAHMKKGDDLFCFIMVEYCEDIFKFDLEVKREIENSTKYFNLEKLIGRDDFVFISSIPWFSFNGIDHTMNFNKDDSITRVSWGKYFENNGRVLLPLNIQVNHIFVDGIHIGYFLEELDKAIKGLLIKG